LDVRFRKKYDKDRLEEKEKEKEEKFTINDDDPNLRTVELWANEDMEVVTKGILELDIHGPWGYLLEVDLKYPKELHDSHNDFPFCAEKKIPEPSPYTLEEIERLNMERAGNTAKLVMDLTDKYNYVIHFRLLQQALQQGLKLMAVHR
jgi:hypothetical protein